MKALTENKVLRRRLRRALALMLAVVLVAGLGLSYSSDRVLKAEEISSEEMPAESPAEKTEEIVIEKKSPAESSQKENAAAEKAEEEKAEEPAAEQAEIAVKEEAEEKALPEAEKSLLLNEPAEEMSKETVVLEKKAKKLNPSISVSPKSVSLTTLDETATLTATLKDISSDNTIVWTSSDESVATVINGVVKATGNGTATITASVSPDEDELYGQTFTATASVKVTFTGYDLYHYALIPGESVDSGNPDQSWFGIGVTKVYGVGAPGSGQSTANYRIGETVNGKTLFPDITYEGVTYKYAAHGSANEHRGGYYTATPFRLVASAGANAGINGYNGEVPWQTKTYHLDYSIVLNEVEYAGINFMVDSPDTAGYEAVVESVQRFKIGTSQSRIQRPSASDVPATKEYNGITYEFDGWYLDEACTQRADFAGTIDGNMTFYGRYAATEARYRIEYYYDGVRDDSRTDTFGPVAIGTEVSGFTAKPKNGFTLNGAEPESFTVKADESQNVMRVYYTKRLISYRVGYYLNNSNTEIASAVTGTVRYGETATGYVKDIEGYTPVSSETSASAVIETAGQEIRFYYYKNAELTAAGNDSLVYNGQTQTVSGFSATDGAEFEGISASASAKDAGTYTVAFSEGALGSIDKSGTYKVTALHEGSMVISRAKASVSANDAGKVFGAADPELAATVSGVFEGDALAYEVSREEGENAGTYAITASGDAVQGNYDVTYAPATFTITKSGSLEVFVNGYSGTYDGASHAASATANVTEGISIEFSTDGGATWSSEAPAITDIGTVSFKARATGGNYEPSVKDGTLAVTPADVTIAANNAGKVFGTEDPELTAEVTGLIGDDSVSYTLSRGAGEDAGEYGIFVIASAVQGNYMVSVTPAAFTISKADLELSDVTVEGKYNGSAWSGASSQELPEGVALSYSLDGAVWTADAPSLTDAGSLTYSIRAENKNYNTAYAGGSIAVAKRTVTLTSGSAEAVYNGSALTSDAMTVGGDGFTDGEGAAYTFTGSQTLPGFSANTFTYALNEGTKEGNYDISTAYGQLTVTSRDAKYSITLRANSLTDKYDGTTKAISGFASLSFSVDGNKYTVEGVTAEASAIDAGTYPVNAVGEAVVLDANGNDVTSQFEVTVIPGSLEIEKRSLTITSGSAEREYNGAPLTNSTVEITGDGFAEGDGASYGFSGSQKTVGSSENTFTYTLNEGTKASNYDIHTNNGLLTVTNRAEDAKYVVTIRANSAEVKYNGSEQSVSGLEGNVVKTRGGEILNVTVDGHEYSISGLSASASGRDANTYAVNVTGTAVVRDEDGNDVSGEFIVRPEAGSLEIGKRSVVMTSGSSTHAYNGKTLMNDEIAITGDGFAEGEGASFEITGNRTTVGAADNIFSYTLNEGTNAGNYDIETVFGKLIVTGRDAAYILTLTPNSDSVVYDGKEHSVSGFISTTAVIDGESYEVSGLTAEATGTEVGEYPVIITGSAMVTDAEGNDVSDQFTVICESGSLTITEMSLADAGSGITTGTSDGTNAGGSGSDAVDIIDTIPVTTAPSGYWALLNLILMAATVLAGIYMAVRRIRNMEDEEEKSSKNMLAVAIAVVLAVVSAIAYILTEDMSNTMEIYDKYTLLMAVLMAGSVASIIEGTKDSRETEGANA